MNATPTRAILGKSCMVSTGHYLSTLAAVDVLKEGGNAIDAAVAASGVSCVVLPHACGLGGDAFAVGFNANRKRVWALNASGRAPRRAALELFTDGIPEDGVVAATVPGIVRGWADMLDRYGTRTLRSLLEPAVRYAQEGFICSDVLADLLVEEKAKLLRHSQSGRLFWRNGSLIKPGQNLVQADLGRTLGRIATNGWEEFYFGKTAAEINDFMESARGLLRLADLQNHHSRWEEPVGSSYLDTRVMVSPPNSIAILLLVQLSLAALERQAPPHNSARYIDSLVRAKRRAFESVLPLLADPESMQCNSSTLLSRDYLRQIAEQRPNRPQEKRKEFPDTTCIVVVDKHGNAISLIQSLYHYFGCGAIAGNTGVFLNNRMLGFSLEPNHPNVVRGGKRPAHTLSPVLVLRNGSPYLVLGTPGAFAQTQTLAQVINNVLLFRMELQQAVEAPRWFDRLDHVLLLENRISTKAIAGIREFGYDIQIGTPWEPKTGCAQAVVIDELEKDTRILRGAADPRRQGSAFGW